MQSFVTSIDFRRIHALRACSVDGVGYTMVLLPECDITANIAER